MSIYVSSQADLAAMVSVAAGVVVAVSDLVFGTPHPTTTAEKAQYGRNTKIAVNFAPASTVGTGSRTLYYDRLDLAPLQLAVLFGAKASGGANLAAMIPVIKNYTGAVVSASDLVETSSTVNPDTGGVEFVMTAQTNSLGWLGTGTLKFDPPAPIATAFTDDKLPGF
jgi:hypothetical protein